MGVYIKGMEIPTSCSVCDIKVRCFEDVKNIEWLTYHPAFYEERLTNCPLTEAPKWIPVTERLPEDGKFVLVCNDDGHMMIAKHETETYEWYYKYTNYDFDIWENEEQGPVCYWMPLPEPPEDK